MSAEKKRKGMFGDGRDGTDWLDIGRRSCKTGQWRKTKVGRLKR